MKPYGMIIVCLLSLFAARIFAAVKSSEISVDLKLDHHEYVIGERMRAIVDVKNISIGKISVGYSNSEDRFLLEVYSSKDMSQLSRVSTSPFVANFMLKPNEGQKLEVFIGDHFVLKDARRYLVRPVLVHKGIRYEGQYRAFDVVPGMEISSARQIFQNKAGLQRTFRLLRWSRGGTEHLFLAAEDDDGKEWMTYDLGALMKITKPTISIMPNGTVIVFHRFDPDNFMRNEFWSLTSSIEFRKRELVRDPETAGQARVQELYKEKGIQPKERSWWKFWD